MASFGGEEVLDVALLKPISAKKGLRYTGATKLSEARKNRVKSLHLVIAADQRLIV
jgi:hypothetical protein